MRYFYIFDFIIHSILSFEDSRTFRALFIDIPNLQLLRFFLVEFCEPHHDFVSKNIFLFMSHIIHYFSFRFLSGHEQINCQHFLFLTQFYFVTFNFHLIFKCLHKLSWNSLNNKVYGWLSLLIYSLAMFPFYLCSCYSCF